MVSEIPVIIRPVDWKSTSFGKLQALPKDAKAVVTWRIQDEAYVDVVKGVTTIVDRLLEKRAWVVSVLGQS